MAKAKAPPPPHVQAAISRGDVDAIRTYAHRGGQANARRCSFARTQKAQTEASLQALIDEAFERERKVTLLRDAEAHHLANLAGSNMD